MSWFIEGDIKAVSYTHRTPECITAVAKMAHRRVVYVSCDPETLARDVAIFARHGYKLSLIHL